MAAGLVGFGGGIVLGSMINSNNHQYYYHSDPWSDSNGGYHQAGYYSEGGYHYSSPQEFGYCPPFGDPGYQASCDPATNSQDGGSPIVGLIIMCCCCICCCALIGYFSKGGDEGNESKRNYSKQDDDDDDDDEEMQEQDDGNVTTLDGEAVSRADAVGFLQAIEAEYVDGQEGSVGNLYDERNFSEEATGRLQCEEDAVRDSDDKQDAVVKLARRWRMRNMLQNS